MNQNTINKITGKKFQPTLTGEYIFTGAAIGILVEIQAWIDAHGAVVTERDGYRFHIFYSGNGTYFNYDGPGSESRCMNLIVEHIESEDAWLHSCMRYRGSKEAKTTLRRYRDIALKTEISKIEEKREEEKKDYKYRYYVTKGERGTSIDKL